MAQFIELHAGSDPREPLNLAVAQLAIGNLVVVPDECGWALVGLSSHPMAGQKLADASTEHSDWLNVVAVSHPDVLTDYVGNMSVVGKRLASRCWPGPVVLEYGRDETALEAAWPTANQRWGVVDLQRRWFIPGDEFFQMLLLAAPAPLLTMLPRPSDVDLPESVSDRVGIAVVGGDRKYDLPPSVVGVNGESCRIQEPGVLQERMLQRLAGRFVLFVCTGNTCRSPMAEALFRKLLADRLGCQEDELIDRGFVVLSAGVAAYRGAGASPEAVRLLREQDRVDLRFHESQPLTEQLLQQADRIFTMTGGHLESILATFPEFGDKVETLAIDGEDIPDPIGGGPEEYERCRVKILQHLKSRLDEVLS